MGEGSYFAQKTHLVAMVVVLAARGPEPRGDRAEARLAERHRAGAVAVEDVLQVLRGGG